MQNIEQIKSRIRKLLKLAEDGSATDGEIENAMAFASKLMDEHHVRREDVEASDDATVMPEMDQTAAPAHGSKLSTWESALAWAICYLLGTVQWYRDNEMMALRINGIAQLDRNGKPKRAVKVMFYGPADECEEAAALFHEWSRSISTLGTMKYGHCFMGDGGKYCYGFTIALLNAAKHEAEKRKAKQGRMIQGREAETTAITVAGRQDLIKRESTNWLAREHGVRLRSGGGSGGYRAGSQSAYEAGKRDGSNADFRRSGPQSRRLPGN